MSERKTVGECLVTLLERRGVDTVFGIPGVHTVELYRGLAASPIRHVTPRHEQSAGFMADGYARATGKPGVCLLITGPGVTNAITPMAQARADSVPMLVISGVNRAETFGHEEGFLHELPDQRAMMAQVALWSHTLLNGADLPRVLDRAYAVMEAARPGPVHIEVPIDVMSHVIDLPRECAPLDTSRAVSAAALTKAADALSTAQHPLILVGGGAVGAADHVVALAEALDAPIVTTTNARGIAGGHPLRVPASPSLPEIRQIMAEADVVLAIGTEFGRTDYDMYEDGQSPALRCLIRVEVDPVQMTRGRMPDLPLLGDAAQVLPELAGRLSPREAGQGATRADAARTAAHAALPPAYAEQVAMIHMIRDRIPGIRIVGDSTQAIYAGNLFADIAQPRGWFNASTGYGALGYGAPAAIGAALGVAETPVMCLTGDGGLQFCLAELGTAMDEGTPVIFLVWNNSGYQEIERFMIDNAITPEGVTPSAPDFAAVASAYGMASERIEGLGALPEALDRALASGSAYLIDMAVP